MTNSTRGPFTVPEKTGESGRSPERLRELFAGLSRGRTAALEDLYGICADELYGLALWRTGSAADASDVVQDVFVRLASARQRLAAIRDPLAYLRRMTHRATIDIHRRRSRRREEPIEDGLFLEAEGPSPERRAEAERVCRLLADLPPTQREVIYLRHVAGCSFAEIGRATGAPVFTAASRYRLGMRKLRGHLGVEP